MSVENLTLLVMKLARRLTITDAGPHTELNHAIAKQATDYLKREGLTSPLRDEAVPPTPASDERGWLVEYNSKIPGVPGGPLWVCIEPKFGGYGEHELAFTNDPNKALRLARKEDAEAIRLLKVGVREANRRKDWYAESFTVTEHMWIDAAIDRSLSGGEGGGNG